MYSRYTNGEEGNISPQLPSFVDVVFILLIFFLVLSIVGFGVVESGHHSEGFHEKEQDISDFPAVKNALQKDINEFIILSLRIDDQNQASYYIFSNIDDQNQASYYIFSNMPFNGVVIANRDEYKTIRTKIENNQFSFENRLSGQSSLEVLQSAWGPFANAEEMRNSQLVLNSGISNLIIQAGESFTYHQILEIMRLFSQFKSVYFEVIENGTMS